MERDRHMAEDPKQNGQQGGAGEPQGGAGKPDDSQKMKRLEAEIESLKQQLADSKQQNADLTESLGKALTEDDVKQAVQAAKEEAEKKQQEAAEAATQREKRLVVENELVKAHCIDTAGAMAHIDMGGIEIAQDGHISGLDVAKLAGECKHLFQQPNTGKVSSAGNPGGSGKAMTKDEIMAIKDGAARRAAIAENMSEFE